MLTSSGHKTSLAASKREYQAHLRTLKELFSDWSEDDLLAVLEEFTGDVDLIISRIAEGEW